MHTEFLQSAEWLCLQEATGKHSVPCEEEGFVANGIEHTLPFVGTYLYIPRGPAQSNFQFSIANFQKNIKKLVEGAKERKMKWVRVEPQTEEMLEAIRKVVGTLRQAQGDNLTIVKAPHDMQPREVFKIDVTLSEEELLAQMKPKTRYNIRLAEKRGVRVFESRDEQYRQAFLDLILKTADRKGITSHPKNYYEHFFTELPDTMCRLFVAEYHGMVVAANLVIFYGDTATYLHGGTADAHRDVMAPYFLQWEQMRAVKARGYRYYDFGGVNTRIENQELTIKNERTTQKDWGGITRFKMGFSPETKPTIFPGTYDIILDPTSYVLYDVLRFVHTKARRIFH